MSIGSGKPYATLVSLGYSDLPRRAMLTVAVQYPSFGPQHPPRLEAFARAAPCPARVVAMEMFRKDSDYEWAPVLEAARGYRRYTVMEAESEQARRQRNRWSLGRAVQAALDEIRPDVLVVYGWGHRESRRSLEWARREGCPVVLLSDSVYENISRRWWKEAYKRWVLRGCQSAFVAGTPQARYVARLGVPEENIFYPGSCSVDNAYWDHQCREILSDPDQHRAAYGLPPRYFLCVARFIPLKNIPALVRAYSRYCASAGSAAFDLVLCGSGPSEETIRGVVRELRLEQRVHFVGFVQVDRLPVYYSLASCFILPSSHVECWGLVVNEAMACALPVLISDQCGCAEDLVSSGRNGFTFDPNDESELADLMLQVSSEETNLEAMAEASKEIIKGHSLEVAAGNLWRAVDAAQNASQGRHRAG